MSVIIPVLKVEVEENLMGRDLLTKSSVEFYSRWMLSKYGSEGVKIMSHEFYTDLKATINGELSEQVLFTKYEEEKISETDFTLIPIFDRGHWSLVIMSTKIEKDDPSTQAVLWFADVAKGRHDKDMIMHCLTRFLSGDRVRAGKNPHVQVYAYDLQVPSPDKSVDCGRYVLYFMQNFLQRMYDTRRYSIPHILNYIDSFQRLWFQECEAMAFANEILKNVVDYATCPDQDMPDFNPMAMDIDTEDTSNTNNSGSGSVSGSGSSSSGNNYTIPDSYDSDGDSDDIELDYDFNLESLLVNLRM